MNKTISLFIIGMMIFSSFGVVFATDDVELEGMNPEQSVGNQGVMILTNQTNGEQVNGLCTDKDTIIYFGDVVPITSGTDGLHNASIVKTLIIQNWRANMTAQQGYDLQGAIWYFTDGTAPANAEQQTMINNALADSNIYPDVYSLLIKNETVLIDNQTTSNTEIIGTNSSSVSVIEQIGQSNDSSSVVTPNGQTITENTIVKFLNQTSNTVTQVFEHGNKICTKTITTVTDFYEEITTIITTNFYLNTTTDNITTYYKNTTTTTTDTQYKRANTTVETWENCLGYLDFCFSSVQKRCKQELILFTVTPREVKTEYNTSYTTCEYWTETNTSVQESFFNESIITTQTEKFNESSTETITDPYSVQKENVTWKCVEKPTNNTIVKTPVVTAAIPMQATGTPLALLVLAILLITGGLFRRN